MRICRILIPAIHGGAVVGRGKINMQIFKSIGSSVTLKDMNLNEIEISGSTNAIVSCVQFIYLCLAEYPRAIN